MNDQMFKKESILQSFNLQSDEELLLFSCVHYFQTEETESSADNSSHKSETSKNPFRRLVCVTKDQNGEIQKTVVEPNCSNSLADAIETKEDKLSQTTEFEEKTKNQVNLIRNKYSDANGSYILVTNLN